MQLSLKKIDDRIQKLQEIRRIAADPEMVAMLFDFIATEDEQTVSAASAKAVPVKVAPPPKVEDAEVLVNQVVQGLDGQGSGLWSKRRNP